VAAGTRASRLVIGFICMLLQAHLWRWLFRAWCSLQRAVPHQHCCYAYCLAQSVGHSINSYMCMADAFIVLHSGTHCIVEHNCVRCSTALWLLAACLNAYASQATCAGINDVRNERRMAESVHSHGFHSWFLGTGLTIWAPHRHKAPHCWLFFPVLLLAGCSWQGSWCATSWLLAAFGQRPLLQRAQAALAGRVHAMHVSTCAEAAACLLLRALGEQARAIVRVAVSYAAACMQFSSVLSLHSQMT
jgi:hypothetical protein